METSWEDAKISQLINFYHKLCCIDRFDCNILCRSRLVRIVRYYLMIKLTHDKISQCLPFICDQLYRDLMKSVTLLLVPDCE